jgi:Cytochrome c7 and related cytochrome c
VPQIFHRSMNSAGRIIVFGAPLSVAVTGVALAVFFRSAYATGADDPLDQPVPFSHMHHVGQLGIDCRYCHTTVETSAFAGVPPTKTCMNCHQQMWVGTEMLAPVRESFRTDQSLPWQRVHNLPDFAYFNHSIHVAKGVGCYSCHGRIDEMPITFQSKTLLMEWCLNCHRNPEAFVRPRDEITSMTWKPADAGKDENGNPYTQTTLGKKLLEQHKIRDAQTLTSCSMCHR